MKTIGTSQKKILIYSTIGFIVGWIGYSTASYFLEDTYLYIITAISILILIALLYKFVNIEMKRENK